MFLVKLVTSERRHAGFDPSGAQSYEYQTWHGQSTVGHTDTKHKQTADSNYNTVYINDSTVLKRKKRLDEWHSKNRWVKIMGNCMALGTVMGISLSMTWRSWTKKIILSSFKTFEINAQIPSVQ